MSSQKISTGSKNELLKISKRSASIARNLRLSTSVITPVNLESESNKFFKSKTYSPRFEYFALPLLRFDIEIDELEQRVEKLELPYDLLFHLIEYLNHLRFLYHARHSVGRETFPAYAKLAFNWEIIDPDSLIDLLPKIEFSNEERGKLMNAHSIVEELEMKMGNHYKMLNSKIKVDDLASNMIFVDFNTIKIGKDIRRFENNVRRLFVHEIESHVLQNHNVKISKNSMLFMSTISDFFLYGEGLAVYNEIRTKSITRSAFQNYYYRLKAVKESYLSFRELYEMLREDGLSEKQAFNISFRVKRGMGDTSKSGCYPKDSAYLLGYKAILDFLNNNDENLLYYSKSPKITKLLLKYNLIGKYKIVLPEFYHHNG